MLIGKHIVEENQGEEEDKNQSSHHSCNLSSLNVNWKTYGGENLLNGRIRNEPKFSP